MSMIVRLALPFSSVSPAAAGTVLPTSIFLSTNASANPIYTGLDEFGSVLFDCMVQGGTGGTLDIYFQSSVTAGKRWYDVVHLPQLLAGAAPIRYAVAISRARGGGTSTAVQVNTTDNNPSIAVNTVLQYNLGDSLRLVYVAGAGTSAGALQTMDAVALAT